MSFDEILLIAVLIMLIASMFMGLSVQRSSLRSRRALESLVKQIGTMLLVTIDLDQKVESLEERIKELEK